MEFAHFRRQAGQFQDGLDIAGFQHALDHIRLVRNDDFLFLGVKKPVTFGDKVLRVSEAHHLKLGDPAILAANDAIPSDSDLRILGREGNRAVLRIQHRIAFLIHHPAIGADGKAAAARVALAPGGLDREKAFPTKGQI